MVVTFQVDVNGGVTDTQIESGHPMLSCHRERMPSASGNTQRKLPTSESRQRLTLKRIALQNLDDWRKNTISLKIPQSNQTVKLANAVRKVESKLLS